jgi:hypothetical protein
MPETLDELAAASRLPRARAAPTGSRLQGLPEGAMAGAARPARPGRSGLEIEHGRAAIIDAMVSRLFDHAIELYARAGAGCRRRSR